MKNISFLTSLALLASPAAAQDELGDFIEATEAETVPVDPAETADKKPEAEAADKKAEAEAEAKREKAEKPEAKESPEAAERKKRAQQRRDEQRRNLRRNRRQNSDAGMTAQRRRICPSC